jgi:AraC-like DNA-binding protein
MGFCYGRSILKVRMIGSIVPELSEKSAESPTALRFPVCNDPSERMDPLSEVLSLLKLRSSMSGGFSLRGDLAICFPQHAGIKCYAVLTGQCWLVVEGVAEPVLLSPGDCFLLPRGLPFRLATDLALEPIPYTAILAQLRESNEVPSVASATHYIAGGYFQFTGNHAETLLRSLPPIVHIRREADKATLRWCLERMREELRNQQPGGSLITQQLAYMMLVQALRLHLTDTGATAPGWLSALSDKHMSIAIACIHKDPGYPWTLKMLAERVGMSRSVFAQRFRQIVGVTPMEYLTRWRMLLASERLKDNSEGLSAIAQSLGYDSESAFGKAFRRVMGRSPRQYTRFASTGLSQMNGAVEEPRPISIA